MTENNPPEWAPVDDIDLPLGYSLLRKANPAVDASDYHLIFQASQQFTLSTPAEADEDYRKLTLEYQVKSLHTLVSKALNGDLEVGEQ